ncbi:hypothetical protein RCH10_005052 [Variovorax sp. GrIS 2.14]
MTYSTLLVHLQLGQTNNAVLEMTRPPALLAIGGSRRS